MKQEFVMKAFVLTIAALILFSIFALCIIATSAHADTTNKRTNAFGAIIYQDNPFTYLYGKALDGTVIVDREKVGGVSIKFQPSYTYTLFTETVLFCGDVADDFEGASLVIVTYERQSHRLVKGVPCHELVRVDKLSQAK